MLYEGRFYSLKSFMSNWKFSNVSSSPSMCKISSKFRISGFARFPCEIEKYRYNIICDWLFANPKSVIHSLDIVYASFSLFGEKTAMWEMLLAELTNVIRKRSFSREKSSTSATRDNGFACRKTPVKLRPGKLRIQVLRRCVRLFRILNSRCGEMNKSTRLWRVPRDKYCWIFFWSVFQWIPQWLYLLRYYPPDLYRFVF